ncbi:MAG: replicative DNA helicase [Acidobacteriota bacterium]
MDEIFSIPRKPLPHTVEAERAVIGGVVIENSHLYTVLSIISPEDFYLDSHRKIMKRIMGMSEKGKVVDLLTLSEELERNGELQEIGGAGYLASLLDGVPRSLNVEYYAEIIKEKSLMRKLIISSSKIIQTTFEGREDPGEILDKAQDWIFEIAGKRIKQGFVEMREITSETLEAIEALSKRGERILGIPTGFIDFDIKTSGLKNSEFIVIAGRPSMGKTAFVLNTAINIAIKLEKKVGIFSLEMSKENLGLRFLGTEAKVDIQKIQSGYISQNEWSRILMASNVIAKAPIFIDESASLSILEMKAKARRLKLEKGLDMLIIDYLQLMRGGGKYENRNQEISAISRAMKELAKEISIPVVAVSQLSRAPEKRERRAARPQLSDLRESGAIEQDADLVAMLYREEFYNPNTPKKGITEIIIAKQRNGPTGTVELAFLNKFARFENLEKREEIH